MAEVSAIVLAAGLSERMGDTNKLFLNVGGKPLIAHVTGRVSRSRAHEIILVTSEISKDKIEALITGDVQIVLNPDYKRGMTTSIQAGVKNTSHNSTGYMICLGDQPLIRAETYREIIQSYSEGFIKSPRVIVLPVFRGKPGNPVVFSSFYKTQILNHTEAEGCKRIVRDNHRYVKIIDVDDSGILADVDTRQDYYRLIRQPFSDRR